MQTGFKYRPEIDGLRAFAVLAVILFHAGLGPFTGGYVGVDVFFVISGYLITSIILTEQQAGTFTLIGFYERRIRRIIPALLFMIVACLPMAWLWLNPTRLPYFAEASAATIGFASNIFFWRHTTYFSAIGEMNPLLHTWSLAIEEQFYLVFPAMMLVLYRFGRRFLAALIAALALGSFALAAWVWVDYPASTFFLTPARAWELGVGCLVAFFMARPRVAPPAPVASTLAMIGFAMILAPVFLFDRQTSFPGVNALYPVLGTALIILFAGPDNLTGRILGWRAAVGIGLISYSAYLWHQPIFAFARIQYVDLDAPLTGLALIALIFAIAWASWRFVETPFRDRSRTTGDHVIRLATLTLFIGVGIGSAPLLGGGFSWRYDSRIAEMATKVQRSPVTEQCHTGGADYRDPREACVLFDGEPTWVFFGDSLVIEPAFSFAEALKEQTDGEGVLELSHTLCPPALNFDARAGCREWTAEALAQIHGQPAVRNVVIAYNHAEYLYGNIEDTYPELPDVLNIPNMGLGAEEGRRLYWQDFQRLVDGFLAANMRVFVLYPHPEIERFMVDMIYPTSILAKAPPPDEMHGMDYDLFIERQRPVFERLDALPWDGERFDRGQAP